MENVIAEEFWRKRAEEEMIQNTRRKHQHGRGICTVFILDMSESMEGEGFRQMKETFIDIMQEYEALNLDDNIAVIGFGDEIRFLHYYSNNYHSIKNCLENIDCKGPSPLEAGILLSLSCIQLGGGHTTPLNPLVIRARVVVITDGNPTDLSSSLESYNTSNDSEAFNRLLCLVGDQGKWNPFTFIAVGKTPNYCLLGALAVASRGGRILARDEARQTARFSLNIRMVNSLLIDFPEESITEYLVRRIVFQTRNYQRASEEDINQICEILNEKGVYNKDEEVADESVDEEFKERYSSMPSVGTRVRRGHDWAWGDQDSHGVGTVVGHSTKVGWINVEWDNGNRLNYRYGYNGEFEAYDLTICDEPRVLEKGKVAVGCLVRKGPDWEWGDQNGSDENIGTVYRVKHNGVVHVRWPNGNKSNYRFGHRNKYDLVLCDPNDPEVMESLKFMGKQ
ncbi:uncharacterized protein LOC133178091 [Saccostrea echinata]|uniref:uncharacterized protein LOC133178091 n=1 Tax=Saccostrea echinata TaxID=191078 RepID=UPI002A7F1F0B|nr:uncharacterized protein LOC133178091 [Saccostrea echinata]